MASFLMNRVGFVADFEVAPEAIAGEELILDAIVRRVEHEWTGEGSQEAIPAQEQRAEKAPKSDGVTG